MKILIEIDNTIKGENRYITYFYHKYNKFVYKVITNGTRGTQFIAEYNNLNKDLKSSYKLPKYILNKL